MASNPPPTGYGRGGRGAALLMAMNAPVRKPGESPPMSEDEAAKPRVPSLGRGMLIQAARGAGAPATPGPAQLLGLGRGGLGRGLGSVGRGSLAPKVPEPTAAAASPPRVSQPVVATAAPPAGMPLGRGRGLLGALASKPLSPAPSVASVASIPASIQESVSTVGPAGDDAAERPPRRPTWMERMADLQISEPVSKPGTSGRPVQVACNYIPLKCRTGGVYQYAVSFLPPLDSRALRMSLLREVMGKEAGDGFDGALLFFPRELPQKETVYETVRRSDGSPVKITVKFVKLIPPGSSVQFYNIILKRVMRILRYCQVGRNFYNSHEPSHIPQHKLEVWSGYVTAIEEYEGGLMLMVDVDHRLLRTETVYNLMADIQSKSRGAVQTEIARNVIGQSVLTRYNNKTYRIDDIDWSQNPASTFQKDDQTQISYLDYYRQQYGKVVEDSQQPLLIHRPKEKDRKRARGRLPEVIALIPELCHLTGLSDDMRSNFNVMKMTGRTLPPEQIIWGNNVAQSAGPKASFSNQIGYQRLLAPVTMNEWILIGVRRDEPIITRFLQMLMQEGGKVGMQIARPRIGLLQQDSTASYLSEIRSQFRANQTQLVMTICPTSRDDRYNAIKKLCYVEAPVASQVINTPTIRSDKKLRAVSQKVALQLNAKLGGELWALNIPGKGLMVCGIDVCHGPAGSRQASQMGFVASLNQRCTRWYSTTDVHREGQEIAHSLRICLTRALHRYHKENHSMPDRIIMFRDGVGDGALPTVAGFEVPQMQAVFSQIQSTYTPKFAMIVVQKRINQRIMAIQGRDLANPLPGTIIDSVITRKTWYDFFLVSQHVGQGTVTPTHFVVVHDSSGWSADILQKLSYKLTHLYYNWPGTVRVPAPCQYAHKLAYMVSQNLSGKEPAPDMCDRLFYL